MGLHWDSRIEQANVRVRLQQLGLPKAAIYAIGCVTHARDEVLSGRAELTQPAFQKASELLDIFWSKYPESLDTDDAASSSERAKSLLPTEEQLEEYGLAEDVLMYGIAYSFKLATMREYSEQAELNALNSIDRAYVFVYTVNHELDQFYKSEDDIRAVEAHSGHCLREIDFQLAFLSIVESSGTFPPPYSQMVALINLPPHS